MHGRTLLRGAQLQILFSLNFDFSSLLSANLPASTLCTPPHPLLFPDSPLSLCLHVFGFKLFLPGFDSSLQKCKRSGDYGPQSSAGHTAWQGTHAQVPRLLWEIRLRKPSSLPYSLLHPCLLF